MPWYTLSMKMINVSTKQMGKFAGMWVAIDIKKEKIVAAAKTLKGIAPLISETISRPHKPTSAANESLYAFKVPTKEEKYLAL